MICRVSVGARGAPVDLSLCALQRVPFERVRCGMQKNRQANFVSEIDIGALRRYVAENFGLIALTFENT